MSDWPPADPKPVPPESPGPGWWLAADGKYYPPEQAPGQPAPPPPQYTAYSPDSPPIMQATSTNGLAIASMVLGILWLYWIGSILALVFGYVAKGQIDKSGGRQTGRGMAIAGIVLGWLGVGIATVLIVLAVAFADDIGQVDVGADITSPVAEGTSTTAAGVSPVSIPIPAAGASITGETPCPAENGAAERTTSFEHPPPMCIDPANTYTATLKTSEGDIIIALDTLNAPITVNNFVVLARYRYFDGVAFHRIVPGFVNQAGDAVGPTPGVGGPGYNIPDELPADPATAYVAGAVAMANSGPASGGSQFFLVIGDVNGALSGAGSYSVFGHVVKGQDISEAINGFAAGESPTRLVTIDAVEIDEN